MSNGAFYLKMAVSVDPLTNFCEPELSTNLTSITHPTSASYSHRIRAKQSTSFLNHITLFLFILKQLSAESVNV